MAEYQIKMIVFIVMGVIFGGIAFWIARYTKAPKWVSYTIIVFGLLASTHTPANGAEQDPSTKIPGFSLLLGAALGLYLKRNATKPKAVEKDANPPQI